MSTPVPLDRLTDSLDKLITVDRPRYRRLWAYYRNPMKPSDAAGDDKPYRQAQEWGLPARITGYRSGRDVSAMQRVGDVVRKEVVIENDIAWRVETMVEYLFGKPLVLASAAADPVRRELITELLRNVLASNGGMLFLQQLALVGSVHGFVDVLVKLDTAKLHEYRANGECKTVNGCGDTQSLGHPPVGSTNEAKVLSPQGSAPASSEDGHPAPSADATDGRDTSAPTPEPAAPSEPASPSLDLSDVIQPPIPSPALARRALAQLARLVRFEMIEPARALPFLSDDDYRVVECYGQVYEFQKPTATRWEPTAKPSAFIDRIYRAAMNKLKPPLISFSAANEVKTVQVVELLTPDTWHRFEDGRAVCSGINSLGELPLVHIQNLAVPFEYSGSSDVEPLIPLQDELNTRLSDRAHRITMQSFKMYLGKGIENFAEMPVAPGRMWATDNVDATVIEFGGDAHNPSEESHIGEIREALDKTSGVSPVAAGGVKNKLGNLTSAAALRVTMQSLLSKTEKKRITFGVAITRMCELALAWLDVAGVFATTPEERRVELHWANPLPIADGESLEEAKAKLQLGIPKDVVARELGY